MQILIRKKDFFGNYRESWISLEELKKELNILEDKKQENISELTSDIPHSGDDYGSLD